ncbi:MAG TPA: FAD:protein FMN transferase [Acidothermaceae bacterium]
MATDVAITAVGGDHARLRSAVDQALAVFRDVESQCSRFDPHSGLMKANAGAAEWTLVPSRCFEALAAAASAYLRTRGRFDPRVHDDLCRLGYARSLAFEAGDVVLRTPSARPRRELPEWKPRFRPRLGLVHLGGYRVDLGGIGKGLAVRWSAETIREHTDNFLVEAGGDCYAAGYAPDGGPWRIGVEDPLNLAQPIAVLAVSDRAVATSSVRIRRWTAGGSEVHHLIDPRTGLPGGAGLCAVTVVGADVADAEVDAKALFLEGQLAISDAVRSDLTAACWVTTDGAYEFSKAFEPYIQWRRA